MAAVSLSSGSSSSSQGGSSTVHPPLPLSTSIPTTVAPSGAHTGATKKPRDPTNSSHLCPLLRAIADRMFGGFPPDQGEFRYDRLSTRAKEGGYLWDELVDAYTKDFTSRHLTLPHLDFNERGHTRAQQQEVLLFPPGTPFSHRDLGRSSIPEAAFTHLIMFITQDRGGAPLDPSPEGLAAAREALAAYAPAPLAEPEPLPKPPPIPKEKKVVGSGGGKEGGGGAGCCGGKQLHKGGGGGGGGVAPVASSSSANP